MLYFKDLELHTIELNKFSNNPNEELADILKKVGNSLDIWSAFLTRHDLLNSNNLPKKLDNASLKKALTVLDVMNFTSEERDAYDDHLKWLRIEANTLKKYEAQARVRGKVEGIQIGKTEEKIAIARNLKRSGVAITIISESTGLTKKQIEELDD